MRIVLARRYRRLRQATACFVLVLVPLVGVQSTRAEIRHVPMRTLITAGQPAPWPKPAHISLPRTDVPLTILSWDHVIFDLYIYPHDTMDDLSAKASWTPEGIELLLVTGDPAPRFPPGYALEGGGYLQANSQGSLICTTGVHNELDPYEPIREALFVKPAGQPGYLAAVADEPWPGQPDGYLSTEISGGVINDEGQFAFYTRTDPGGYAYWEKDGDDVRNILHLGIQAPSLPPGYDVTSIDYRQHVTDMNQRGEVAVSASTKYVGPPLDAPGVLWKYRDGEYVRILKSGDPFLDYGPDATLSRPLSEGTRINNRGDVLFNAHLYHPDFTEPHISFFLYEDYSGRIKELAGPGPIYWQGEEYTLSGMGALQVHLNDRNELLFGGGIEGPGVDDTNNLVLAAHRAGETIILAREGMQAPGLPDGVTFGHFRSGWHHLNNTGMVVFEAILEGPGIDDDNWQALYVSDLQGNLSLILQEGDSLDLHGDGSELYEVTGFDLMESRYATISRRCLTDDYLFGLTLGWSPHRLVLFDLSEYAPPPCPGDLNHDRRVDQRDLGELLVWYGREQWGDLDGDGDTDAADLGILLAHYEATCE